MLPVNLPPTIDPFVLTIDQLESQLFATNHKKINKYNKYSIFDYIFYNWKNRLARFIISKFNGLQTTNYPIISGINDANYYDYILTQINDIIKQTIQTILGHNKEVNNIYLSDNVGLFGNYYLVGDKISNNIKHLYSSCITNTILEIYLLGRIYEESFGYGFEHACKKDILGNPVYNCAHDPNYKHDFWTITQDKTQNGVSHWVGVWKRLVYKNDTIHFEPGFFRSIYPNTLRVLYLHEIKTENDYNQANKDSITISKKFSLLSFMYLPIDYRIEFIRQNSPFPNSAYRVPALRNIATKINDIITNGVVF